MREEFLFKPSIFRQLLTLVWYILTLRSFLFLIARFIISQTWNFTFLKLTGSDQFIIRMFVKQMFKPSFSLAQPMLNSNGAWKAQRWSIAQVASFRIEMIKCLHYYYLRVNRSLSPVNKLIIFQKFAEITASHLCYVAYIFWMNCSHPCCFQCQKNLQQNTVM